MLRYLAIGVCSILLATGGSSGIGPANAGSRGGKGHKNRLPLSVYDPLQKYDREDWLAYEHLFVDWQDFRRRYFRAQIRYAEERNRHLVVTVEPWPEEDDPDKTGEALFSDILEGAYDRPIKSICKLVGKSKGRPLVRWGHEMEGMSDRYPWAREDSAGYVDAYRYFATKCRDVARKVLFIWSPLGHEGLENYYPGDTFVDLAGLPMWGYEKADIKWFGHPLGFDEIFTERYDRVAVYGKPVVLTEAGVAGSRKYEKRWIRRLKSARKRFPLLHSALYFNFREPFRWPDGLGRPDWRIDPRRLK